MINRNELYNLLDNLDTTKDELYDDLTESERRAFHKVMRVFLDLRIEEDRIWLPKYHKEDNY